MKHFKILLVAAVAVLVAAGVSQADVVSVSSTTVTRIARGDGSRKHLRIFNDSTKVVYIGLTTSSTTVNAGFPLFSSTTVSQATLDLRDYAGNVYGLLEPGASATVNVKKLEIPR